MRANELKIIEKLRRKKNFWNLLEESNILLKDFIEAINSLYSKGLIDVNGNDIKLSKKRKKVPSKEII
jgi:predicted methyltransferase